MNATLVPRSVGHLDPIELLFHLMKGIVADLTTAAHDVRFLARRRESPPMEIAVRGSSGLSFFWIGVGRSQMRDEFLAHGLSDRRSIVVKNSKPRTQRAFTRGDHFVTDGVVVSKVERAQERAKGEALKDQRAEDDRERRKHNQVAVRKRRRQCHRRRQRDDAAHAGPRDDQTAANRRAQHRTRWMKAVPAFSPSDDSIEGHLPDDADNNRRQEHGGGDGKYRPRAAGSRLARMGRICNPMKMNASTFNMKTTVSHTA